MDTSYPPEEGDTYTYERTFTPSEVRQFADLSGDDQDIHTEPDEDGRLIAHGLLTATIPTVIGGALEILAYHMDKRFHRPVYTGERITCEATLTEVEEREDRYAVTMDVVATNPDGEDVMTGETEGIIWKDDA